MFPTIGTNIGNETVFCLEKVSGVTPVAELLLNEMREHFDSSLGGDTDQAPQTWVIRNILLSESRPKGLDIVRKSKGKFPIKKWTWANDYLCPQSV